MKALKAASGKRKLAMLALALVIACAMMAFIGCSPKSSAASGGAQQSTTGTGGGSGETTVVGYPDFLNNDSGMYADTYYNSELLNLGNRGCNACHTDLFSVMNKNEDGFDHILVSTGYGKNGTYKDCEPCHRTHMNLTGMYMGDIIHASHYSNETFVAANGNCWSCHSINADPDTGKFELVMFDDIADTAALGGFPDAGSNLAIRDWLTSRGFSGGLTTSMNVESNPNISATFDQEATNTEDVFVVNNWGTEMTTKGEGENIYKIEGEGENFDLAAASAETNSVAITGVNNPQTFTKADLEAMPQTDFTMHLSCGTNGNGGCLTSNVPMTGVSMEYVINLCGGLVDGNNAVTVQAYDGWIAMGMPLDASLYTKDGYLVTKQFGEDLTMDQGSPILLVSKGGAGVLQVKHIKSVDFAYADAPFDKPGQLEVNGMWFQNNGAAYQMGETVELSAATYAFVRQCGDIETVSFSFDMGKTWKDYNMASEINGYDPYQLIHSNINWKPSAAGTYEVMMQATTTQGVKMTSPVSLIVVVSE